MASLIARAVALLVAATAVTSCFEDQSAADASALDALCPGCNVVLVSFDTLRADHMSAYGYERATTPNLEKLAARSLVFDKAISQAPWTLPAHGSIFSGLYPARLGVLHYPAVRRLPDVNPMLAEIFAKAGYATAGFTGGGFVSAHYGFGRGFDVYSTNGRHFQHSVPEALNWLDLNKKRKFFLFVHGYDSHRPYFSARQDKVAVGLNPTLPSQVSGYCFREQRDRPSDERLAEIVHYYDASIHAGDRHLGPVFDKLEELELMEKTVVIVTSDHGDEFYEHGNCDHVRFVYNEVVHVPLMIYVPGVTTEERHHAGQVPASIAIARTALDLVGVTHSMPGVSLTPILAGQNLEFPVVYSHADTNPGNLGSRGEVVAMSKDEYRLFEYLDEGSGEGYNIADDPAETTVLPEGSEAYRMRGTLRAWHDTMDPLPKPTEGTPRVQDAASRRERLDRKKRKNELARKADAGGVKLVAPAAVVPAAANPAEGDQADDVEKADSSSPPTTAPSGYGAPDEMEGVPDDVRESLKALGYIED
jgi:arylsulfatase A-like enzyme